MSFESTFTPYAQKASQLTGVPAPLILAQWKIESAGGTSYGAQRRNNLAGIGGAGGYRSYPTVDAFVQDYANLINKRYPQIAQAAKTGGVTAAAKALGQSPWAAQHYRADASGKEGGFAGTQGTEGVALLRAMGQSSPSVPDTPHFTARGTMGTTSNATGGTMAGYQPQQVPNNVNIPVVPFDQAMAAMGQHPQPNYVQVGVNYSDINPDQIAQQAMQYANTPVDFPSPDPTYDKLAQLNAQRMATLRSESDALMAQAMGANSALSAGAQNSLGGLGGSDASALLGALGQAGQGQLKMAQAAQMSRYDAAAQAQLFDAANQLYNKDFASRTDYASNMPKVRNDALTQFTNIAQSNQTGLQKAQQLLYDQQKTNADAGNTANNDAYKARQQILTQILGDTNRAASTEATTSATNQRFNASADNTYNSLIYKDQLAQQKAVSDASVRVAEAWAKSNIPKPDPKTQAAAVQSIAAVTGAAPNFTYIDPGQLLDPKSKVNVGTISQSDLVASLAMRSFSPSAGNIPTTKAYATLQQYAQAQALTEAKSMTVGGKEPTGAQVATAASALFARLKTSYDQLSGVGLDVISRGQLEAMWAPYLMAQSVRDVTAVGPASSVKSNGTPYQFNTKAVDAIVAALQRNDAYAQGFVQRFNTDPAFNAAMVSGMQYSPELKKAITAITTFRGQPVYAGVAQQSQQPSLQQILTASGLG